MSKKPAQSYIAEIEARVCGIPCIIGVIDYEAYVPAHVSGPPENCYPAEGGYGSWDILDTRGRPAPWLEKKMKLADHNEVDEIIFNYMEGRE